MLVNSSYDGRESAREGWNRRDPDERPHFHVPAARIPIDRRRDRFAGQHGLT